MDARKYYGITVLQIVVCCGLLWFIFTMPGPWDSGRIFGAGFMILGMGGIAVARYQLGRSFAIKAEAHQLVTRGVYSKIRNPIYVFGTAVIAGFVLIIHMPAGWLFLFAIVVIQILRARREAHVLEAAFGDAYREYRSKTWF
jgi:protein-S-isoprenylcysteine O-methyltransferase Ste14